MEVIICQGRAGPFQSMLNTPNALSITRKGRSMIGVGCKSYVHRAPLLTSLVQEKYRSSDTDAKTRAPSNLLDDDDNGRGEESTSESEEDDDGILASGALDAQVQETLDAIRKKDPRVYDANVKFYNDPEDSTEGVAQPKTKEIKPMHLSDYHRQMLLEGTSEANGHDEMPLSYMQQQDHLKQSIVQEINGGEEEFGDDEGFLVKKVVKEGGEETKNAQTSNIQLDIQSADQDPDKYLSNFMSARAWTASSGNSKNVPFESDDDEEELRAEAFEQAYNLRFEDPKSTNEKLISHARDTAAKYSVRKDEVNPRKKAREAERTKKEAEKQIRKEEKARLRKLKVGMMEDRIKKIREAAGLRGASLSQEEDWSEFLDNAWDDAGWDVEMRKRFGDEYYAEQDAYDSADEHTSKAKKIKKPKWQDDIGIDDLIPDFDDNEIHQKSIFELTGIDEGEQPRSPSLLGNTLQITEKADIASGNSVKKQKDRNKEKRKEERLVRRKIEQAVDEHLEVDEKLAKFGRRHAGQFRYRETSPVAWGLTAQDILMADDSQLNQYAGLKKLAAFRDPEKKKKDKKQLGKKARLRQWRKDTFGNEHGPQMSLADALGGQVPSHLKALSDGIEGKSRQDKRSLRKAKN